MGWIYKGLKRANFLQEAAQNINDYILQIKREKAKQRLQQLLAEGISSFDELGKMQSQQSTDFIPGVPGLSVGKILSYPKYNKQYISNRSDEIQTDFMKKLLSIDDVDDESISKSLKMIELLAKRFKKEPEELIKIKEGETAFGYDKDTGQLKQLYTAPKKREPKKYRRYEIDSKTGKEKIYNIGGRNYLKEEEYIDDVKTGNNYKYIPIGLSRDDDSYKDLENLEEYNKLINMINYSGTDPITNLPIERTPEEKERMRVILRDSARGLLKNSNAYAWYKKKFMDKRTDKNKHYAWGRENVSPHDFLAEIIEARDNNEISTDAFLDLERFANYRDIFWDLDAKNYKKIKK